VVSLQKHRRSGFALPANLGSRGVIRERFNGDDIYVAGALGGFRLELNLETESELNACAKELCQTHGSVAREPNFFARNALNPGSGHEAGSREFTAVRLKGSINSSRRISPGCSGGVAWSALRACEACSSRDNRKLRRRKRLSYASGSRSETGHSSGSSGDPFVRQTMLRGKCFEAVAGWAVQVFNAFGGVYHAYFLRATLTTSGGKPLGHSPSKRGPSGLLLKRSITTRLDQ
jgi:hypothetical protein